MFSNLGNDEIGVLDEVEITSDLLSFFDDGPCSENSAWKMTVSRC